MDEKALIQDVITLVVQVNGKLREKIQVPADIDEQGAKEAALQGENVQRFLDGKEPKKVIYVPGRLINIVI